ncbi:mitochondrial hypoxia responsive domain-containing protein [Sphaerosporella brunnea]|uniref:Mitochondrial hypoxia responsive domain-containing protein n=1 Tax=Sphaerosporella brunnea TaxID=1250544 RepID=A0A5J5F5E5_9PEZI|nr:mitochondrial hypoxia responsive domain-containing protein [Sphaerosporella brunnea]
MKLLTPEEEKAHYRAVLTGGTIGGVVGLAIGLGANAFFYRRSPFYRSLTVPLRAFFISSTSTFGAIIEADRYSRAFEASQRSADRILLERRQRQLAEEEANMTKWEKAMKLGKEYRYTIVTASWAAAMAGSLAWVSRDKYLTTAQKLVQARVYAQGLTLLILVATAGFEVADARAAKKEAQLHPGQKRPHREAYAGEDLWKDMIEAEEKRQAARQAGATEQ